METEIDDFQNQINLITNIFKNKFSGLGASWWISLSVSAGLIWTIISICIATHYGTDHMSKLQIKSAFYVFGILNNFVFIIVYSVFMYSRQKGNYSAIGRMGKDVLTNKYWIVALVIFFFLPLFFIEYVDVKTLFLSITGIYGGCFLNYTYQNNKKIYSFFEIKKMNKHKFKKVKFIRENFALYNMRFISVYIFCFFYLVSTLFTEKTKFENNSTTIMISLLYFALLISIFVFIKSIQFSLAISKLEAIKIALSLNNINLKTGISEIKKIYDITVSCECRKIKYCITKYKQKLLFNKNGNNDKQHAFIEGLLNLEYKLSDYYCINRDFFTKDENEIVLSTVTMITKTIAEFTK